MKGIGAMANRIKQLRERNGMKQNELASFLNITQATLSNWERGVHDPDNATLIVLSKKFNVSTDYLLGKSEDAKAIFNVNNINNSNLIQGTGNVLNETNDEICLSVDENELIRIYRLLNAKQRHRLMSFAFDMEEKIIVVDDKTNK